MYDTEILPDSYPLGKKKSLTIPKTKGMMFYH